MLPHVCNQCAFCFDTDESGDSFISACNCPTLVHTFCLTKWLTVSGCDSCRICLQKYNGVRFVKRKATFCDWCKQAPHAKLVFYTGITAFCIFVVLFTFCCTFFINFSQLIPIIFVSIIGFTSLILFIIFQLYILISFINWRKNHYKITIP